MVQAESYHASILRYEGVEILIILRYTCSSRVVEVFFSLRCKDCGCIAVSMICGDVSGVLRCVHVPFYPWSRTNIMSREYIRTG